jgi:spermidine/putrescine-binding protein
VFKSWKVIVVIVAFFAVGVGWGLWYQTKRRAQLANATPLRVLCADNWISPGLLEKFSAEHGVPIQFFTYSKPSEFLRQMANSDGKVDVVCSSSLLLRSLVRSHWIKSASYAELPNAKTIAVDFLHLPYDTQAKFGLPLFWNLYGFFGKDEELDGSIQKVIKAEKVAVWGDELNILHMLGRTGVNIDQRVEQEEGKGLETDIRGFLKTVAQVVPIDTKASSADAYLGKWDWIELPLARVADYLSNDYHFVLPDEGAAMEIGLVSVGEKSTKSELALMLINELVSPEQGLETHRRLNAGVVHQTFDNVDGISSWQRPQALRKFQLNRLAFPDLNIEALPRFEKIYDENTASKGN